MLKSSRFLWSCFALMAGASFAHAQLRLGCWNVSNWNVTSTANSRAAGMQVALFDSFQGRSARPDILMLQEIINASSLQTFVNLMNTAPGSPGDYAAYAWPTPIAPQTSLPDTQSALIYRTSKIVPVSPVVTVAQGSTATTNQPRNTYRFDFNLVGYGNSTATLLSAYVVHFKAGSGTEDRSRRLVEAQRIRLDANNLSPRGGILVAGDFNIDSSSESSYQELTLSQLLNTGRMIDPINTPGSWRDNRSFRFVHTQDPWWTGTPGAGMDDRYDFIMMNSPLLDGEGVHYIGNANIPYSTTTWNDPNHSFRVWGNDGNSWVQVGTSSTWSSTGMTITNNQMVGTTIANAIIQATGNQSTHCLLLADLRVPAAAATNVTTLDFGMIPQNFAVSVPIQIDNVGNRTLWGNDGIADLSYSFNTTGNFTGPSGTFTDRADDGPKVHNITMNTTTPGRINGTLTISTNDPLRPTITIQCTGLVVGRMSQPPRIP